MTFSNDFRKAMFKNAKLRLLITLLGFERQGTEDILGAPWVVPSTLSGKDLEDLRDSVAHHMENPDGQIDDPLRNIRRKPSDENSRGTEQQPRLDVHFGSDSEGEDIIPDGPLFPPNLRTKSNALTDLKKRHERSTRDVNKEPLDDELVEERRRVRDANAAARLAKIKSDLYIHASDEESDEEADRSFFLQEEDTRKAQVQRIKEALLSSRLEKLTGKKSKLKRGRKETNPSDEGELDMDSDSTKRRRRHTSNLDDDYDPNTIGDLEISGITGSPSSGQDDAAQNTPPTSTEDQNEPDLDDDLWFKKSTNYQQGIGANSTKVVAMASDDSDEEHNDPVAPTTRRRMKAGFVIDSDSE